MDEFFTTLTLNKMMVKNLKLNAVQYKRKSMSPGLNVRRRQAARGGTAVGVRR